MITDLDPEECVQLLRNNYIGRLAYDMGQGPFVIPVTYHYYDQTDSSILSYSLEGHKIDTMRINPSVCVQVDEIESITQWKSVLVHGELEVFSGIDAQNLLHEFSKGSRKSSPTNGIKTFSSFMNFQVNLVRKVLRQLCIALRL